MTAQVNRLSLHLHPLDYFIFPILAFYNFLQRNTRHTLKMRSVVRDSNLRDSNLRYCYICPTKSLSSRLLCTCEVVRMNLLSPLHHLPVSSHSVLSLFLSLCPSIPSTSSAPPAPIPYYQIFPYKAALEEVLCHCCMH